MNEELDQRTTTERVGAVADFPQGTMKMATVGTRRVAVIRTPSGLHALDNACPHQGYGLVTGALDDELVTCQWHNWKFDARDGSCVRGEEAVACHAVTIDGDDVLVTVVDATNDEKREALWPSLRSGMERHYVGQVARDTARLIDAEATPAQIMAAALEYGAPRNEWGVGHEMAMAADCLTWSEARDGEDQVLPLVHGLSGITETSRDRPPRTPPAPDASIDFSQAVEGEDVDGAMAAVLGALDANVDPATIRHWFIDAATRHHLDYGHGIIYTQKAFELLERIGWDHAADLLPHLAVSIGWGTREDVLPYMRKAAREIEAVDCQALAAAPDRRDTGWADADVIEALLTAGHAPIDLAVEAVLAGAGVEGLLDACVIGASRRLLRHDLDIEFELDSEFGWLDITHALTMARAVRWAWQIDPGPHTARGALFATWLLFDSGRSERRHGIGAEPSFAGTHGPDADRNPADLARAIRFRDAQAALEWVHGADQSVVVDALTESALADQSGSFIVTAHVIKLAQAAAEEAETLATHWDPALAELPLLATTRFLASPRLERFVARNVAASQDFVRTGNPPKR